jgi:general secretion pathway protein G
MRTNTTNLGEETKFSAGGSRRMCAFSLVELVIVMVIIGIVAAIAIPRISMGATDARANALRANLSALNRAVEYYAAEHENAYPTPSTFEEQLTKFTNLAGAYSDSFSAEYRFGPYLKEIPKIGVGPNKGGDDVGTTATGSAAWVLDTVSGIVKANGGSAKDSKGKPFSDY